MGERILEPANMRVPAFRVLRAHSPYASFTHIAPIPDAGVFQNDGNVACSSHYHAFLGVY